MMYWNIRIFVIDITVLTVATQQISQSNDIYIVDSVGIIFRYPVLQLIFHKLCTASVDFGDMITGNCQLCRIDINMKCIE